jgi:hypothetical protein
MKSMIKGSNKANFGAGSGAGAGAETFWKLEPVRKQKVSAPQHCKNLVLLSFYMC